MPKGKEDVTEFKYLSIPNREAAFSILLLISLIDASPINQVFYNLTIRIDVKTKKNGTPEGRISGLSGIWRDILGQGVLGYYESYLFHFSRMVFHFPSYGVP